MNILSFPAFVILCVTLTVPVFSNAEYAYFLLNSECINAYTCTGEIHDVSVVCLNSKCICDPRLAVYDPLRYQCVGKADHACLGDRCTRNAHCEVGTNTCKCLEGYEITHERCLHGHDGACDEDEDCKRGFLCYDGKCECRYPNHQYYHAENDTCYSIAQSWDTSFSKVISERDQTSNNTGRSYLYTCFEMLFLLAHVLSLVLIAYLLHKIGKLFNQTILSIKLNGYFLRTGIDGRSQDSVTLDAASFFDGDSKV